MGLSRTGCPATSQTQMPGSASGPRASEAPGETQARPPLPFPTGWDQRQPVPARAWREQYKEKPATSPLTRSLNVLISSSSSSAAAAGWGASDGELCSSGAAMLSAGSGSGSAARGTPVNVVVVLPRRRVLGAPLRTCRALHQRTGRVGAS